MSQGMDMPLDPFLDEKELVLRGKIRELEQSLIEITELLEMALAQVERLTLENAALREEHS